MTEGSFSSVSTPIFATKYLFFERFEDVQEFVCTNPDFFDFSIFLYDFLKNSEPLCKFSGETADFLDFI